MYKNLAIAIWLSSSFFLSHLSFFSLSFVHKSQLTTHFDFPSATPTHEHTHRHSRTQRFFVFSDFRSKTHCFYPSHSTFRSVCVSLPDRQKKKKRFFSSFSDSILFLTAHSFFSMVFFSPNFESLSLHVGNEYWVCDGFDITPFCFFR